jgi:hypothetical protein
MISKIVSAKETFSNPFGCVALFRTTHNREKRLYQTVLTKLQDEILLSLLINGALYTRLDATISLSAGSPWKSSGSLVDRTAISGDKGIN